MSERLGDAFLPNAVMKCLVGLPNGLGLALSKAPADAAAPKNITKLQSLGYNVEQVTGDFDTGHWVSKGSVPPPKDQTVVLYIPGGGWANNARDHLEFAYRMGQVGVDSPIFGWVYDVPVKFSVCIDKLLAMYKHLDKSGYKKIVLVGGSAGANLALALMQKIAGTNLPKPAALFIFSAFANFSGGAEPSFQSNKRNDWITPRMMKLTQELYLSDPAEALDPLASPLLMSEDVLRSLPPTMLAYSVDEALKDQNEALLKAMQAAGCDVSVRTFTGIHCAILWMTGAPAADFYQDVAMFIQKHSASHEKSPRDRTRGG